MRKRRPSEPTERADVVALGQALELLIRATKRWRRDARLAPVLSTAIDRYEEALDAVLDEDERMEARASMDGGITDPQGR